MKREFVARIGRPAPRLVFDMRRKPRLVRSYDRGLWDALQINEYAPGRHDDRHMYSLGYRHGSAARRAIFARLQTRVPNR